MCKLPLIDKGCSQRRFSLKRSCSSICLVIRSSSLWPKCFLCITNGITGHGRGSDPGFYYWDEWYSLVLWELMTKVTAESSPFRWHALQTSSVRHQHKSRLWISLLDTVHLRFTDIRGKVVICHAALDTLTFERRKCTTS